MRRAAGCRPPWHDRVAVEHAAIRERAGIIDMTSFGKLELAELDVLERVCGARIDRPVGSIAYTQLLDERGRIVGDVTVTRLADDRFRVVTGAGAVDSDRGFLELHGARVTDVTDDWAVIGLWGPAVRGALADFPFRTARDDRRRRRVGARPADDVRRRVRLRALRPPGRRAARLGLPRGDAAARAGRLPGARLAADREGLPLLRHRPHGLRHAVRLRARVRGGEGQVAAARPRAADDAADAPRRRRGVPHRLRRRGGAPRRRGGRPRSQRRATGSR